MRRPSALLAALLIGSAAGVVAATGPAAAAACPTGQGITVVVGSSVSCDADGGGPATGNFTDTGHSLTMVDRQPGFVCRVDGAPSSGSCVNTPPSDAYWGLFWSNGTSGTWTYASQGAGSLKVPAGGWVAFVFQNTSRKTYPGVDPISAAPAPAATAKPATKATPKATARPTAKPAAKPAAPSAKATAAPSSTPTSSARPTGTPSAAPTATAVPSATAATPVPSPSSSTADPGADETDDVERTSAETDSGNGSLGWVAAVLVVVLLGGMGAVLWRRKVAGGPS